MKRKVESSKAPDAAGPYSQAIEAAGMVFASGQLPIDSRSGEIPASIEEQTRASLENLSAVLEAAGCSLSNVVKTTVFLDSMDNFGVVNSIYAEYFEPPFPGRSCFQVAKLPRAAKVEIEAIAIKNER